MHHTYTSCTYAVWSSICIVHTCIMYISGSRFVHAYQICASWIHASYTHVSGSRIIYVCIIHACIRIKDHASYNMCIMATCIRIKNIWIIHTSGSRIVYTIHASGSRIKNHRYIHASTRAKNRGSYLYASYPHGSGSMIMHVCMNTCIICRYNNQNQGYMHHGYMHHGYMHRGYMHHVYMHHGYMHHGYMHRGCNNQNQGYMHHGYMHHGFMHHGYMHHGHIHHGHICVGQTAWPHEGCEGQSQAGPKDPELEVGAQRASRLLVFNNYRIKIHTSHPPVNMTVRGCRGCRGLTKRRKMKRSVRPDLIQAPWVSGPACTRVQTPSDQKTWHFRIFFRSPSLYCTIWKCRL